MAWMERRRRVTKRRGHTFAQAHAMPRTGVRGTARRKPTFSRAKAVGLALVLLAAVAIVVFSTSPAFFVYSDETRYVGLHLLTPEAVWQAAGIPDGLSVFFVHTGRIAQALRTLPEVKDVRVTLRIPNRLTIAITERAVRAAWTQAGATWWVDETGHVLAQAQGDIPADALRIASMVSAPLQAGSDVSATAVRSALRYHERMPEITRFRYAEDTGLSLMMPDGWPVHVGDDRDCELKLARLKALVEHFAQRGIRPVYVDLRAPDAPAYRR